MKILPKQSDFYNIDVDDGWGSASAHPVVKIYIGDESDDGLPPLVDKLNEYIEKGFRFTRMELGGDMIGYKYFKITMMKHVTDPKKLSKGTRPCIGVENGCKEKPRDD